MIKLFRWSMALGLVAVLVSFACPVTAQDANGRPVISVENAAAVTEIATLEGHTGAVNSVAFSPDSTWLASGGDDTTVRLWDVGTKQAARILEGHTGAVNAVTFVPDGTQLAAVGDVLHVPLLVWNIADGTIVMDARTTIDFTFIANVMQVTEENPMPIEAVAIGYDAGGPKFWGFGRVGFRMLLPGDNLFVSTYDYDFYDVAFSPPLADSPYPDFPESLIAMGRSDGLFMGVESTCCIDLLDLNVEQNVPLAQLTDSPTFAVAYNADGSMLAAGGEDTLVRLWDVARDSQQNLAELSGHTGAITAVAFSPDATLVVSASLDGTLRLWDVARQALVATLTGPEGTEFRSVAFSPDGTLIASAGNDGQVRVWGIAMAGSTVDTPEVVSPEPTTIAPTVEMIPTVENAQIQIVQVLSAGDLTNEAVVMRNVSGGILSLQGWTLHDTHENSYTFPDFKLFPDATISIATRTGTDFPVQLFWNRDAPVWEIGDVVSLLDAEGNLQATLVVGDS